MKRILGITTAALMGASVLAAPAIAQTEGDLPTQEFNQGTTTMPDVDAGTTAAIGAELDGALTAIAGSSMAAQSIGTLTEVETVNIVRIDEISGGDPAVVDDTVTQNEQGVEELRAAISANAALSSELSAQGVETSSVVGAEMGMNGDVTVYVM